MHPLPDSLLSLHNSRRYATIHSTPLSAPHAPLLLSLSLEISPVCLFSEEEEEEEEEERKVSVSRARERERERERERGYAGGETRGTTEGGGTAATDEASSDPPHFPADTTAARGQRSHIESHSGSAKLGSRGRV